jgi:hypothetical protein
MRSAENATRRVGEVCAGAAAVRAAAGASRLTRLMSSGVRRRGGCGVVRTPVRPLARLFCRARLGGAGLGVGERLTRIRGADRRYAPYVFMFTEQGVAMFSSVLGSERAIAINIEIACAFVTRCAICSALPGTRPALCATGDTAG